MRLLSSTQATHIGERTGSPQPLRLKTVHHSLSRREQAFSCRVPLGAVDRRRRATDVRAVREDETASGSDILVLVEQTQRTLRSIFVSALPGPLAFAPSYLVPLASGVSIYGATSGHKLLHLLQSLQYWQAPKWIPMAQTLQQLYSQHSGLVDIGFDTVLASLGALLIFLGLPAMDLLLGMDNPTSAEVSTRGGVYKGMLHSHLLAHWLALMAGCSAVANPDVHPLTLLALVASLGCGGSLVFVVAHELLHSPSKLDRTLASAGLLPLAYMHWVPSHLAHHRNVGTAEDAATARLGESLYAFVPRSIWGNLRDGVAEELSRLESRRLPFLSLRNRIFQWAFGPACLLAAIFGAWGSNAAALGIGQAVVAIIMLEDVNYIEHYGLVRRRLPSGRYEKTSVFHSWNANWLFTNSIIFNLQRHSDHHAHAHKPFQRLEDVPEAPQLPASYPMMMLLALLPGLFFDVMDPRALRAAQQSRLGYQRPARSS